MMIQDLLQPDLLLALFIGREPTKYTDEIPAEEFQKVSKCVNLDFHNMSMFCFYVT